MDDLKARFLAAPTYDEYLRRVEKNRDLWRSLTQRVRIPEEILDDAKGAGTWHFLVLSEDWCGDAVNLLPVLARFVAETDGFDLRVLARDENPDLMDDHLTNGRSRSIPVVMLLDEDYVERAWWGPRPEPIQTWFLQEGFSMESGDRYKEIRRWYARDKGTTFLREIMDLMMEHV